ncbi:hypothetical protein C0989_006563 [Termitomyces sp. Mn162]|nr:hypothetical protein C0989_006563 [Termitomyces sp. Mn162]
MASIPCPTCGQFPSALTAPPTILEHAHAPPPDLPTFDNEHDELVYLRDAVQSLREQADEFHLLKSQVPDVARVCDAVARGDLSQKITVPVHGAIMVQIKDVVNTMVDKLSQFTKEGTRISQKVGMEECVLLFYSSLLRSINRGQALILDVAGTWRKLMDVVNKLTTSHQPWRPLQAS